MVRRSAGWIERKLNADWVGRQEEPGARCGAGDFLEMRDPPAYLDCFPLSAALQRRAADQLRAALKKVDLLASTAVV